MHYLLSQDPPYKRLVAQLAKAKGLKVIASAGSAEKVEAMKRRGVDVASLKFVGDVEMGILESPEDMPFVDG